MQSSREYQGDIRRPSKVNNAKKNRETIEWERLEIPSRKYEVSREHFMQGWALIKDRNVENLTKAEEMEKLKEYTEVYKKGLNDPDSHDGVITYLQPDILECEVKWTLGSITTKLVEVMEFWLSYFNS